MLRSALKSSRALRQPVIAVRYLSSSPSSSKHSPYKVFFCGTDEFSIASLEALLEAKDTWTDIHVLTPPQSKYGRGGSKTFTPPLMEFAKRHNLSLSTLKPAAKTSKSQDPSTDNQGFRDNSTSKARTNALPTLTDIPPSFSSLDENNLLVTASFGHILTDSFLSPFPTENRLNVHPSLLPRYRGAAPIQWTIANGDKETGVTVQNLAERSKGIDAGDIVGQIGGIPVDRKSTYHSLYERLAKVGGQVLVDVVRRMIARTVSRTKQERQYRSAAPKINKETAHVDWTSQSSTTLDRLHRGIGHQQPLWTETAGVPLQLLDPVEINAEDVSETICENARNPDHRPGQAWLDKSSAGGGNRLLISCVAHDIRSPEGTDTAQGLTWLSVENVKPAGSRKMSAKDFFNGSRQGDKSRKYISLDNGRYEDGADSVDQTPPEWKDGVLEASPNKTTTMMPTSA